MFSTKKVRLKKRLIVVGLLSLGILIGLGLKSMQSPQKVLTQVTQSQSQKSDITANQVQSFLIAYYTKQELGENRDRYQGYFTSAAYQTEVGQENQPTQQAYKGFVINQVFDSAKIYLDQADHQALVTVNYHNQQKKSLQDSANQATTVNKTETLVLTYAQENKKWLVNNISHMNLTKQTNSDTPQDLNSVRNAYNSSEGDSSND